MSDGIEEAVLLLVSPNLTYEKDGIDHHTRDQQSKKNNAEYERNNLAPMKDNPTDV
jgi:hypothetical protein